MAKGVHSSPGKSHDFERKVFATGEYHRVESKRVSTDVRLFMVSQNGCHALIVGVLDSAIFSRVKWGEKHIIIQIKEQQKWYKKEASDSGVT